MPEIKTKKITKEQYENMSIEDLEYFLITRGLNKTSATDKIRQLNRQWNKDLTTGKCQVCNYNKHVELAHLKAIPDFDKKSLLKEVNHKDNVLILCPNCHWEYDFGVLSLEDIGLRKD